MRTKILFMTAGIGVGVAVTVLTMSLLPGRGSVVSSQLLPTDVQTIAQSSLDEAGATCGTPEFRPNHLWLVTCTNTIAPAATCGVPFYNNGVRYETCATAVGATSVTRQYLLLVDDRTGKVVDYAP